MKASLLILLSILIATNASTVSANDALPLRSVYLKDVDGDGKADKFVYEVKKWETEYEGSLKIVSAQGDILWEHRFLIMRKDLFGDPNWLEGRGLKHHVKYFFAEDSPYPARVERIKLKDSDLDDEERLAAFAKHYGISPAKLKQDILSQQVNTVVSYRAEWREDLNMLVYVPSIKKFICYKRGY